MPGPSGEIPNKPALGTWAWAVYQQSNNPKEIDDRIKAFLRPKNGKAPDIIDKPKDVIELIHGGKVAQSRFFRRLFLVRQHAHRRQ